MKKHSFLVVHYELLREGCQTPVFEGKVTVTSMEETPKAIQKAHTTPLNPPLRKGDWIKVTKIEQITL